VKPPRRQWSLSVADEASPVKPLRRRWRFAVANGKQVTVFNRRHQVGVVGWSLSSCTTDSRKFEISVWKNLIFFLPVRSDWNSHCAFHKNNAVRSTDLCIQTASLPNSTVHMTRATVLPLHNTNWGDAACFPRNRHQMWKHYSQKTYKFYCPHESRNTSSSPQH